MKPPHALPPTNQSGSTVRYPGLDCLRVFASLLVVVLHAGMPYMTSPMPGLVWCTEDRPSQTLVIDALGWGIDTFVMPVFFLMGGYLACQSCLKRRGSGGGEAGRFAYQRTLRLGMPFAAGFVLILPLDFYVWILGWVCEDRVIPRKLKSLKVGDELSAQLTGPGHLWFLIYLWLFSVAAALAVHLWQAHRAAARPATLPFRQAGSSARHQIAVIAGLFATSLLGLYWKPVVVIGFEQAILPQIPNILYYAPCFGLGWFLQATAWKPRSALAPLLLTGAFALFPFVWVAIGRHVAEPAEGLRRLQLVTSFTACGWLAATGLFALALQFQGRVPRTIAYLSHASLWIYLAHHPVVALTQISLRPVEGSGVWKCAAAASVGLLLSLLTFEAAIRGRWLDGVINGVKPVRPEEILPRRRAA